MRFNYNKTCLNFLDEGISNFTTVKRNWHPLKVQAFLNSVSEHFPLVAHSFKKNVRFISQPFLDAFWKHKPKLINVLSSERLGDVTGTMIIPVKGNEYWKTIFYRLKHIEDEPMEVTYIEFSKEKDQPLAFLDCFVGITIRDDKQEVKEYTSDVYDNEFYDRDKQFHNGHAQIATIIGLLVFLKVCELEVKIVKPKEKHKHKDGNQYLNETKQNIEIIDSTWFTTIVRSEGFGVDGHFRLQPYKTGKKLIWISSYEKHGYTRKAKIAT